MTVHDREMAAIRALIHEVKRLEIETRKDLRAIAAIHRSNNAALERSSGARNGHTKPKR
jgi:hypothetical protein